jgi:fatty acid desaturase
VTVTRRVVSEQERPRVSKWNDHALEYVIFLARLLTIVGGLAAVAGLFAFIWTIDVRWFMTLLLSLVLGGGAGVFGFGYLGNAEWRRHGDRD